MSNVQLVYCSRGIRTAIEETLVDIGRVARSHNATKGISGALCFAYGEFLQVLEGPPVAVNELYIKITRDHRHDKVQLLGYSPIEKSNFSMWSMKTINLANEGSAEARFLVQHQNFARFTPSALSAADAVSLLVQLARVMG